MDLEHEKTVATLKNLQILWRRPVHILTKYNAQAKLLSFDGKDFSEKDA
jgi:stage V sporulation protein R